ncbi:hypothetical protein BV25DRAFT_1996445, partial [Artomyces pyxidatus]
SNPIRALQTSIATTHPSSSALIYAPDIIGRASACLFRDVRLRRVLGHLPRILVHLRRAKRRPPSPR